MREVQQMKNTHAGPCSAAPLKAPTAPEGEDIFQRIVTLRRGLACARETEQDRLETELAILTALADAGTQRIFD